MSFGCSTLTRTCPPSSPSGPTRAKGPSTGPETALDVLRDAGEPLTAREIARRIARAEGITDNAVLYSIECSLHVTLPRRPGVIMVGKAPKRWAIDGLSESAFPD
jgi:hypothetical protein